MGRRGRNNLANERLFFITTTVVNFVPIFKQSCYCEILLNNFKFYKQKYAFKILAYVIMPSHFHWIVYINPEKGTISDIMRDIKKSSARQIFDLIEENKQLQYDLLFQEAAIGINDQNRKLWMQRFDDEVILTREMLMTKIGYIHNNPVKAGLAEKPEAFYYSSAKEYINSNNYNLITDTNFVGFFNK